MDLLMVRDKKTGRFLYTESMGRREGETSWEYVRRSVRREARMRERFGDENVEVLVGWEVGSVEEFLRAHPEYRPSNRPAEPRADEGKLEEPTSP